MSASSEKDIMVYLPYDSWNGSADSLLTQKILKISQSESVFTLSDCKSHVIFSELDLLRNLRNYDTIQHSPKFMKVEPTKQCLKEELEILRINLSADFDRVVALRQSQILIGSHRKKRKSTKSKNNRKVSDEFSPTEFRELFNEIERSDSAKRDKVIWKFLKRDTSFKKEAIDTRKSSDTQLQGFVSNSFFENEEPIKITCPNCKFFITTTVKRISSMKNHINSLMQTIIGFCIFRHIPLKIKDSVHLCPLCEIYLGYCPASNVSLKKRRSSQYENKGINLDKNMVSASSTSAKNLFGESKLRLSDRVQVNVNNIAAITRQIQRGSKSSENLMVAAKNFALQEAAIENSETNLKKLKLMASNMSNQLDSLHNSASKIETVLEQVCSMQR